MISIFQTPASPHGSTNSFATFCFESIFLRGVRRLWHTILRFWLDAPLSYIAYTCISTTICGMQVGVVDFVLRLDAQCSMFDVFLRSYV